MEKMQNKVLQIRREASDVDAMFRASFYRKVYLTVLYPGFYEILGIFLQIDHSIETIAKKHAFLTCFSEIMGIK